MSTFLTADTHFGHTRIIEACGRPYTDAYTMNRELIENWNSVVHPRDTVWHLGDFAMGLNDREISEIFYALNGMKHLIIGNHDVDKKGRLLPALAKLPWQSPPTHQAEIKQNGQRIILSHYAGYTWNAEHRGSYLAYGHSHGNLMGMPGSIDVGVDVQGYRPISTDEFIRQADETIKNADKHIDQLIRNLRGRLPKYKERVLAIKTRGSKPVPMDDNELI